MYYLIEDKLKNNSYGIIKKIMEQINSFNNVGLACELYQMQFYEKRNILSSILCRLPFGNRHKSWSMHDLEKEEMFYIRRFWSWDSAAVLFFEKLKKKKPNIKIVYEIPTYPYDSEMNKSLKGKFVLLRDKYNRRHLYKFIDRIATLTDDKEIFGIPTLHIGNGIDVDRICPRQVRDTGEVHAIAVANFAWWHGYDRFLEGLKVYYAGSPTRKVILHLVGHGSEFGRYQKMVADYGLGDHVILHGQQTGEALDAIYDQCNLGIASLGFHRTGLTEGAPLKTREYLAKGLPFIFGAKVSDISDADKDNIYLQVPNDDSPIDIEAVLNFYDRIYSEDAEQVNTRLRQFAKDHFSMEAAMKEVIDFFKEGK